MSEAPRATPAWARVADLLALALLVLALLSALRGGLNIDWGPLHLTMSRPSRLLTEAFTILLVRQTVWPRPGQRGRVFFVLFLVGLLCGLSGESRPRWIGDGLEYLVMGLNLAQGKPPALAPEELKAAAAKFGEAGELIRVPLLLGVDGRQDFPHFWFYPLLAAPFVRVALALGVNPTFGFTALNILLLGGAAWLLSSRLPAAAVLLIVGSPILWWIDKAHTEVLTVTLLSMAAILLAVAPAWALPVLAAAAAQNPPLIAFLILAFAYVGWFAPSRDPWLWATVPLATALAILHPWYYGVRLGRWSPLTQATTPHLPTLREVTTTLWDPNLGIFVYDPALAFVFAAGIVLVLRSSRWRRPEWWLVLAAAGFLLSSFAQTSNFNHGGTPGPTRYGLWLIPFAIPALLVAEGLLRRKSFLVLSLVSFMASLIVFAPRLPQSHLVPSPLARWLWTRAPGLDNPLPEVFVERTGQAETWRLPVATPRCEKALLAGTGATMGLWPVQCAPLPPSAECVETGVLCYANRRGEAYSFVRAPRQPSFFYFRAPRWYWRARPGETTLRLLRVIPWEDLHDVDEGQPGTFVLDKGRVGQLSLRQSPRALLAWLDKPRPGARLTVRVPRRMTGLVVAPGTGDEYARLDVPPDTDFTVTFPWVWPMAMLLVAEDQ